jgi:Tol biopolymer transport system component
MKRFVSFAMVIVVCSFSAAHVTGQNLDRIFYSTFSPQGWDVFISLDQGETVRKLTDHPSLDYGAVVSPDNRWVVFTSERDGMAQLYALSLDNTDAEPIRLFNTGSFQDQAVFSPDGTQLAFVGSHEGNADIYLAPFLPGVVQIDSLLVNITNNTGGDFRPAFSPDGSKIVFTSDRDHEIIPHPDFPFARQRGGDIYSIGVDGSGVQRLTENERWDGTAHWSSIDGKIYFYSQREGTANIFRMNSDGTDQQRVFTYEGPAVGPVLLENGDIVFTTWLSETQLAPMRWIASTGEIMPFLVAAPHVANDLKINVQGAIVFHGGDEIPLPETPVADFGFPGNPLAYLPDTMLFSGNQVNIYGVRRAFVAPPGLTAPVLYFDSFDIAGFWGMFRPLGYVFFAIPLLVFGISLYSIVVGLLRRKYIPFGRHAVFSALAIGAGAVSMGLFYYVAVVERYSVGMIMAYMTPIIILLAVQLYYSVRLYRKMNRANPYDNKLQLMYVATTAMLVVGLSIITFGYNYLLVGDIHFYGYNYQTGQKEKVFTLKKAWNTNFFNFTVLDSKVTHDGQAMLITTSSFRADPDKQGDIWKYTFNSGDIELLSTTDKNDGFADLSSDNARMVFRSGRSGNFDIYLSDNGRMSKLTDDEQRDNFPAISPDGMSVVFASDRLHASESYKTFDIFMMREIGRNTWSPPERISVGTGQNAHPHFSPDGKWVIYTTEGYGINDEQPLIQGLIFSPQMYGEIIAYHVDTKERVRLTHNKWEDGTPLWVGARRE